MIPLEALNEASRVCWEGGIKVLQGYRLDDTDERHLATLLLMLMDPEFDTRWIDIGCGFGEPARLLQQWRPDLELELINNNEYQLSKVPRHLSAWCADMHELPFLGQTFDGAMFLYSLCHGRTYDALKEAARVVKPGGRLFVFDYVRDKGNNRLARQHLGATFLPRQELWECLYNAGWEPDYWLVPAGDDALFRSLFGDGSQGALYEAIFSELTPIVFYANVKL